MRIHAKMAIMSETKLLAWNTSVQMMGKAVSTAIGVVVIGLMTRSLGQEGFGIYTTATAFYQVFALILDLGINVMLVQMLGEHAGDKAYEDRATSATFTLRLFSALILLTAAPILGLFMPYPWILKLALFAIWGSFLSSVLNQIVIGVQQRHFKMHIVALAEVVGRLVTLVGIIAARHYGWGLVTMVFIVSLGGVGNFLFNFFFTRRIATFRLSWDPDFWRTLLTRTWPIGVSIIFNLIYFKADTLVLSYVRPMSEVGIYGAAYRVLEILNTLPFMYAGVLLPLIAHAWGKQDRDRYNRLIRNSYAAMTILAAPMLLGTAVLGGQIMRFVAGQAFAASGDVLKILMLAVAIIFFGTVSSHAIVALNAQRRTMPLYITTALIILVSYIIFIPVYGMFAAAWLTVASEAIVAIGTTLISLRITHTHLHWSPILKAIAAAIIMALAIEPLKNLWLPIPLCSGVLIYSVLILLFGAISRDTLKEILSFRRGTPTADITT